MPFITFDSTNGTEIAEALSASMNPKNPNVARPGGEDQAEVFVSPTFPGPSLSLDWRYWDGQVTPDRYRIPLHYTIDTDTGQVFAPDDTEHTTPVDINTLMEA